MIHEHLPRGLESDSCNENGTKDYEDYVNLSPRTRFDSEISIYKCGGLRQHKAGLRASAKLCPNNAKNIMPNINLSTAE